MTRRLDGGLATLLQRQGLPPLSPVEPWLVDHPARIQSAHQEFVDAGAESVLCATFMAASSLASLPDVVRRAVTLASACGVEVWGCSGPVAQDAADYGQLATVLHNNGVNQLVLETFTTAISAREALIAVRRAQPTLNVVVSVVATDGRMLHCSTDLSDIYAQLLAAGAMGVGANCATPEQVLTAHASAGDAPFWAKPSHVEDWSHRTRPLRDRCAWLGGCCGVSPADLAALWAAP